MTTAKQIIIDNVDVSGCTHKKNDACMAITDLSGDFCHYCDDEIMKDCYYKQLKQAEQTVEACHKYQAELEDKLESKEQECEELKKELHKNFKEKDTLHLIIDRLLEASGYDTNTASAEDFEDVYEHMRYEQQQLDQLKAENDELKEELEELKEENEYNEANAIEFKQTLTEIKKIAKNGCYDDCGMPLDELSIILQKISEVEDE